MYVTYQYPTQVHGINGLHYVADPNMLASGRDYPPNRCFCPTPPQPEPAKKVVSGRLKPGQGKIKGKLGG
jgi:hypothetical protein